MDLERVNGEKLFPETILDKIFEASSSQFLCQIAGKYGKILISIFQQFFVSILKIFILVWKTGH